MEVIGPPKLKFNNDVLAIEYASFSSGFDVTVGLDVDLCAEYESFSFDPNQTNILFKSCKFEFVNSETFVPMTFILHQTLAYFDDKRLVDSEPTVLPRPMTNVLANYEYICLISNWVWPTI